MILHIDMDAFFASVEQRENPGLRGKPVVVGALSGRSVVCSASYEARLSGVKSAMSTFEAKRLCPGAVFIPPSKEKYSMVSGKIMKILSGFSPVVEKVSVDEAFLDISGLGRLYGTPLDIAMKIKKEIKQKEDLTCSAGIAPAKFLAKIASDINKPDGLFIITENDMPDFIERLALEKIPGVGRQSLEILKMLGLSTLGDIKRSDRYLVGKKTGILGEKLFHFAEGIDSPVSGSSEKNHSVSREMTFEYDVFSRETLKKALIKETGEICRELRSKNLKGRTVSIKIKTACFLQTTKSKSLEKHSSCARKIFTTAASLLETYEISMPVRLIGISVSSLASENMPSQTLLFSKKESDTQKWERLKKAIDRIAEKFGNDSVVPAFMSIKTGKRND